MEKLLNPYDKEFMRMAMLKHEETFKEQVHELHRLYQIQKILMKNIQSSNTNGRNQELWSSKNGFTLNQLSNQQHKSNMQLDLEQQPADVHIIAELNGNSLPEMIDESEIELTLGPTTYGARRKKPDFSSDSGRSFSSSSTGSSHIRANRARELLSGCELGLYTQQQPEILNQPPWLFQVLSLKLT